MSTSIRQVKLDDAPQILEIYGPLCEGSTITFEIDIPEFSEIRCRIERISNNYPWLVCERSGCVLGYAYACQHRERAAYRWSVDVSVYIREAHRGQGIGRALYTTLFEILPYQGFCNIYAGITLPNPASVGLHQAMGFESVGVYRRVGFKLGRWLDVAWFQKEIASRSDAPEVPKELSSVIGSSPWNQAMQQGVSELKLD